MAVYKVTTPAVAVEGAGDVSHVAYAGSSGAAKRARKAFAEAHGFKLNDIEITEAPTRSGKSGLIAYLNAFHAQVPATYKPAGYEDEPAGYEDEPASSKKAAPKGKTKTKAKKAATKAPAKKR